MNRDEFFAAARIDSAERVAVNRQTRGQRLYTRLVTDALKSAGQGSAVKALLKECTTQEQLEEASFTPSWFERQYPHFPAILLAADVDFAPCQLNDCLLKPARMPQILAYFKTVSLHDIDDSCHKVCCAYRVVGRIQCVHNLDTPTVVAGRGVLTTMVEDRLLHLQWYDDFLSGLLPSWQTS